MTTTEKELRDALAAFMAAAAQRSSEVAPALRRITDLQQKLGPATHPMLRHYLERRSYQKALEFLQTGEPETNKPKCDPSHTE